MQKREREDASQKDERERHPENRIEGGSVKNKA
jgi:hypothetical protein